MVMLQNTNARKYCTACEQLRSIKEKFLIIVLPGLHMVINEQEVYFRLIGEFNAYNLLAVYGAAICMGEEKHEVLKFLSVLTGAGGKV
jgi:UDP-N-acetylmuramoyl-L-alanyl-D-glutamate--2,6-diaminopimelate ligase